jgi:hypothetical protein
VKVASIYLSEREMAQIEPNSRKYHFLVLPRVPYFLSPGTPSTSDSDQVQPESRVPDGAFASLSTLLKSNYALPVLEKMQQVSQEVVPSEFYHLARSLITMPISQVAAMIRDEMVKNEGFAWDVNTGFHAHESMPHVHL